MDFDDLAIKPIRGTPVARAQRLPESSVASPQPAARRVESTVPCPTAAASRNVAATPVAGPTLRQPLEVARNRAALSNITEVGALPLADITARRS
jgi:hypothetical protein